MHKNISNASKCNIYLKCDMGHIFQSVSTLFWLVSLWLQTSAFLFLPNHTNNLILKVQLEEMHEFLAVTSRQTIQRVILNIPVTLQPQTITLLKSTKKNKWKKRDVKCCLLQKLNFTMSSNPLLVRSLTSCHQLKMLCLSLRYDNDSDSLTIAIWFVLCLQLQTVQRLPVPQNTQSEGQMLQTCRPPQCNRMKEELRLYERN